MSTYQGSSWSLFVGSSEDVLPTIADCSIDALVTDPPAGISFMNKGWDGDKGGRDQWIAWLASIMRECYRAMKPGAHGLVWALPRTSHWTATACEDAGFEIRDVHHHLFGTGFPKSKNVGGGLGTALKPAAEHWVLIRKPLEGTVAANVLKHGTGGINIDGCRVAHASEADRAAATPAGRVTCSSKFAPGEDHPRVEKGRPDTSLGRWPAHLSLDEFAAGVLDEQSAPMMHSAGKSRDGSTALVAASYNASSYELPPNRNMRRLGDSGGASRFFYVAKGSRAEKDAGLADRNDHPTVKSIALMRWLVRLITPPGGVVLDPFAGSGTTLVAARMEGARAIGIEQDPGHADKAARRVQYWAPDKEAA